MQTYLVHMRAPRSLKRDLGWFGFMIFQLVVGGAVLSALLHPIFVAALAIRIFGGSFLTFQGSSTEFAFDLLHMVILIGSYLASGFLGTLGLMRRRLLSSIWVLGFMPIHWMLLSIAARRAIFQLIFNPFHWETEHGLARTSRRVTPASIKYSAEDPRRLRQATVSN